MLRQTTFFDWTRSLTILKTLSLSLKKNSGQY